MFLNLNFDQVQDICADFLQAHPRETIIMSLKQEDQAPNDSGFQARFKQYTDARPSLWYLENAIPTLSQVRTKIVLLRRFEVSGTANVGINAFDGFPNDGTATIAGPPKLVIQDQYDQGKHDKAEKWAAVQTLLTAALKPDSQERGNSNALYLNFGSAAYTFEVDYPLAVANYINPRLIDYFGARTTGGRFGIVVMDFQTIELNSLIVRLNPGAAKPV